MAIACPSTVNLDLDSFLIPFRQVQSEPPADDMCGVLQLKWLKHLLLLLENLRSAREKIHLPSRWSQKLADWRSTWPEVFKWKVHLSCHWPFYSFCEIKSQLLRLAHQQPAIWRLVQDSLWICHRPGCINDSTAVSDTSGVEREIDPPAGGCYWLTPRILSNQVHLRILSEAMAVKWMFYHVLSW